jgi:hypothetical protein
MVLNHAGVAGLGRTKARLAQEVLEPLRGCRWMHDSCKSSFCPTRTALCIYAR